MKVSEQKISIAAQMMRGKMEVTAYKDTTTQFYTLTRDGILFIFFEGSVDFIDWINDFIFFRKRIPYKGTNKKIRVHSGFLSSYLLVRDKIQELAKDVTDIVISGHSLGGAVAHLAGLDIQYNFPEKNLNIVTFAAPRLGTKKFAESFNRRVGDVTEAFENYGDVVPHLPFKLMFFADTVQKTYIGNPKHRRRIKFKNHLASRYLDAVISWLLKATPKRPEA
jgi:hypothetical protein